MGLLIGGLLLIAFALWTVIAPRQQWQVLNAWRYRDPDANEPSDLSYNLGRAAGVGTIVLVLVVGFIIARPGGDDPLPLPSRWQWPFGRSITQRRAITRLRAITQASLIRRTLIRLSHRRTP